LFFLPPGHFLELFRWFHISTVQAEASMRMDAARFTVDPLGDARAHPFTGSYPGERVSSKAGILIVDDEDLLRDLLKAALHNAGFAVWSARAGAEALRLYQRHRKTIDLVLLDVRMPQLDGPETLARLRQINPTVRCCFVTGDSGAYSEEELLQRGALCVVRKPFRLGELIAMLERLTAKGAAITRGT
jgi:CheY-like chemotaxis protein